MGNFNFKKWQERIANRTDMTGMVTHLTKPTEEDLKKIDVLTESEVNLKAVDNLIKILIDKKINGSTSKGFINGDTPAVCFQEVPMYSLVQNVKYEQLQRKEDKSKKIRYCGVGLAFGKFYVFTKGGRPVIYDDTETMKTILPKEHHWRIVKMKLIMDNPNIIDWSHEREWRCPESFSFELRITHIILYDNKCYKYFCENCPKSILDEIYGITILKSILM